MVKKPNKKNTAILISGRGSNMNALIHAAKEETYPARVNIVIADREAEGLKIAQEENIKTEIIDYTQYKTKNQFEEALHTTLIENHIDIICLAGFMRILSSNFVAKWTRRILNIHPSLLPKYKGLHTHQRAIEAGDPYAGCTVHYVAAEVDGGEIIDQIEVPILEGETPHALGVRVLAAEHNIYPQALKKICGGLDASQEE